MNLDLYLSVLWRFRILVLVGVLLATGLALLSYLRVDFDGATPTFSYRASETWESSSTILVSERGFPAGVSLLEEPVGVDDERDPDEPVYSDPSRFEGLAVLYAKFAESDEVRAAVDRSAAPDGSYSAQPMKTDDGAHYLPFVLVTASASSPNAARELAKQATAALRAYIFRNQEENGIPADRRTEIPVVNRPDTATLVSGRSPVKPIFIMLIGLAATLGLAFVLENLRPRVRPAAAAPAPLPLGAPEARRSAQSG